MFLLAFHLYFCLFYLPGDVSASSALVSTGSPLLKISGQPAASYYYLLLFISNNCNPLCLGHNMSIISQALQPLLQVCPS